MPGQHSMLFSSMLQRQLAVGRSVLLPTWTHCKGQQRVQCKWLLAGCQVSTAFISGRAAAHKDSTWQVTVALVYVGPGGHQSQPCLPIAKQQHAAPEILAHTVSPVWQPGNKQNSTARQGCHFEVLSCCLWRSLAFDVRPVQQLVHWPCLQPQTWQLAVVCLSGAPSQSLLSNRRCQLYSSMQPCQSMTCLQQNSPGCVYSTSALGH